MLKKSNPAYLASDRHVNPRYIYTDNQTKRTTMIKRSSGKKGNDNAERGPVIKVDPKVTHLVDLSNCVQD
jgi:hypothetical protein